MDKLRLLTSAGECREIWKLIPQDNFSDLWEVRECFHKHFNRPFCFIVSENEKGINGLIPLSWVEESHCYQYFPGETWSGKTWLEQNKVIAESPEHFQSMLAKCPGKYHLRYLMTGDGVPADTKGVDEIGYLFHPPQFGFDIEKYFDLFSGKSAKRIHKEIEEIKARGIEYRLDDMADFDRLVALNVGRFGAGSYFHDERFRESFRDLMNLLRERGWLRITTILVAGELAAVDIGCVYKNTYTLLGGGTSASCPGIAKLINIHHMERACREKFDTTDFLCGDFCWKKMFHLTTRPLYLVSNANLHLQQHPASSASVGSTACVA